MVQEIIMFLGGGWEKEKKAENLCLWLAIYRPFNKHFHMDINTHSQLLLPS